MEKLSGEILSEGIAIGSSFFIDEEGVENSIDLNLSRFKKAILSSKNQIMDLKKSLSDEMTITNEILDTHLELLFDPILISFFEKKIKEKKSFSLIFEEFIKDFENKIKDPFFKQRIKDIEDVLKRIKSNLRNFNVNNLTKIFSPTILISKEIIPSDLFEIDNKNIVGIISQKGSYFSHAAIIARSKAIPFLSNIDIEKIQNIKKLILDCDKNNLILDPSSKDLKFYKEKTNRNFCNQNISNFEFFANICNVDDEENLKNKKIKGIGLFRSEFLFFRDKKISTIKNQVTIYKKFAKNLNGKIFVIRLFDFGDDKIFDESLNLEERGIGFLLKNEKLLKDQLKSILKSSIFANIYLLIPYVKNANEILKTIEILNLIKNEFKNKNTSFGSIKIGSMIETIEAINEIDKILDLVDFISIGTNDLSRSLNKKVNELDDTIKNLIEKSSKLALEKNKEFFLCGEIASNPKYFDLFIKMGIKNLSLNLSYIN